MHHLLPIIHPPSGLPVAGKVVNKVAFCGVFFGSPFVKLENFQWFQSLDNWKKFRAAGLEEALQVNPTEEEYYVKKNCYGHVQKDCSLKLLPAYWEQCESWKDMFEEPMTPTLDEVYNWLI